MLPDTYARNHTCECVKDRQRQESIEQKIHSYLFFENEEDMIERKDKVCPKFCFAEIPKTESSESCLQLLNPIAMPSFTQSYLSVDIRKKHSNLTRSFTKKLNTGQA